MMARIGSGAPHPRTAPEPQLVEPAGTGVRSDQLGKVSPSPRDAHQDVPDAAASQDGVSLANVSPADTAALANMSRPKMMTILSRVETYVETALKGEIDPVAITELQPGLKVVGEHLRRLSLVQGGSDAVIGQ
jgi:hypothetical protein